MSEAAESAEVTTEVVFIQKLVEWLVAGEVLVPRFQRRFVWRQQAMVDLLDSVFRGFPIGSVLVWDTEEKIPGGTSVGPVPVGSRPEGRVGYLLDGQQRVSTLVGVLRVGEDAEPVSDSVTWRLYFDLEDRRFVPEPREGATSRLFPMRSLMTTAGFLSACRRIEDGTHDQRKRAAYLDEADRLSAAFKNYQIPVIRIRKATLDTAVDIFTRLNSRGTKMTPPEMVSALTYKPGAFYLAGELEKFQGELAGRGFGGLDPVFVLRAVLAALNLDIYRTDWTELTTKETLRDRLPGGFEQAKLGIGHALDFLATLGVTSDRLLPYGLQLALLAEFFRLVPDPEEGMRDQLAQWFWVTSFTTWFGGVNNTQAMRALEELRQLAEGKLSRFEVVRPDTPSEPFPDRFDGRSARVRAFLLYLVSLKPRALEPDPIYLDVSALFAQRGHQALGHISSNARELGELYSSPGNRMFLAADHRGQAWESIDGLDPAVQEDVLSSHGFSPAVIEALRAGDRAEVVRRRLEHLIDGELEFLGARGVAAPLRRTAIPIADSDSSDDDDPGPDVAPPG